MTGAPAPAVTGGVDVDAVAEAVTGCPDVAGLSGGPFGTAASYLPGRRVVGVRVPETPGDALVLHVVGVYGPSVAQIAEQARSAAAPLADGRPVDVVLEDLTDPAGPANPADPVGPDVQERGGNR